VTADASTPSQTSRHRLRSPAHHGHGTAKPDLDERWPSRLGRSHPLRGACSGWHLRSRSSSLAHARRLRSIRSFVLFQVGKAGRRYWTKKPPLQIDLRRGDHPGPERIRHSCNGRKYPGVAPAEYPYPARRLVNASGSDPVDQPSAGRAVSHEANPRECTSKGWPLECRARISLQ
jgi:hypothetical protein